MLFGFPLGGHRQCLLLAISGHSEGYAKASALPPIADVPCVLRHTFAVTAAKRNISLPSLQRLVGHDHLGTTQIYLNLSPEEVIREFNEKW